MTHTEFADPAVLHAARERARGAFFTGAEA